MRPIRGVVLRIKGSALVVKLESGSVIEMPQREGLQSGSKVQVSYDFTSGRIREINKHVPNARTMEMNIEEPVYVQYGEDNDIDCQ